MAQGNGGTLVRCNDKSWRGHPRDNRRVNGQIVQSCLKRGLLFQGRWTDKVHIPTA